MVAERSSTRPASSSAMAAMVPGTPRQPTLAEEIEAVEQAERVTAALQAVGKHGMNTTSKAPQNNEGDTATPKRTPKKAKTPSPVRVDPDGQTWTWEDDDNVQEENGSDTSGDEEEQVRSPADPRARAGSVGAKDLIEEIPKVKPLSKIIKTLLYPEGV